MNIDDTQEKILLQQLTLIKLKPINLTSQKFFFLSTIYPPPGIAYASNSGGGSPSFILN